MRTMRQHFPAVVLLLVMATPMMVYLHSQHIMVQQLVHKMNNNNNNNNEVRNEGQKQEDNFIMYEGMTPAQAESIIHGYMTQRQLQCRDTYRAGKTTDGGWDVCLLPGVAPSTPCYVYSFGIRNDWSFDDAMAAKFGCQVRSYDPSMKQQNHSRSANVKFFKVGLGGENKIGLPGKNMAKWSVRTFKTLLQDQNHDSVDIDYLKFDVDGNEWEPIINMYKDRILERVKQIGIEIHIWYSSVDNWRKQMEIIKLFDKMGFKKWHVNDNQDKMKKSPHTGQLRPCCYELYYVNERFLRKN